MGAVAAVRVLHRRRLADVPDDARAQVEAELAEEHTRIAGGVEKAVAIGVVDEVVEPSRTRSALATALADALAPDPGIRGHHGNIPL
jgi:acetyl-CoA/propionyl-CoA carboxylase carboxyl transferase subunit